MCIFMNILMFLRAKQVWGTLRSLSPPQNMYVEAVTPMYLDNIWKGGF